jgi:gentisate 1,2-dioxygenase
MADEKTLLDWFFDKRDEQRASKAKGTWLIKAKDTPWENNRQGKQQWFLHPAMEDLSIRSLMVFRQEIPPGGCTGVQRTPGGQAMFIVRGRGYTLLDGKKHEWEAEDVLNIPIRADGVVMQHFNRDNREPVLFICADLNLIDMLGVDRGSVFEQLQDAPK